MACFTCMVTSHMFVKIWMRWSVALSFAFYRGKKHLWIVFSLKEPGDSDAPLYLGIPTLPLLCGGRPIYQRLSKEIPTLLMSHKSTREIPTLPLIQQRDWHLFSVSLTASAEANTYSALDWHCTRRIPSPVYRQRSFKDRSVLFIQIAMNNWSPN